jgi:hypothetical protein
MAEIDTVESNRVRESQYGGTDARNRRISYNRDDQAITDDSLDDFVNSNDEVDDDCSTEVEGKITNDMKKVLEGSAWLRKELRDGGLQAMISNVVRAQEWRRRDRRYQCLQQQRRHQNRDDVHRSIGEQPSLASVRQENSSFDVFCDKLLVLAGVLEREHATSLGQRMEGSDSQQTFSCVGSADHDGGNSSNTSVRKVRDQQELERWLDQTSWHLGPRGTPSLALKALAQKPIPKFEAMDVSSSYDHDHDDDDHNTTYAS